MWLVTPSVSRDSSARRCGGEDNLSDFGLEAALQHPVRPDAFGIRGELCGWTPPPKLVDVGKERGIGPERGQQFEKQRQLAVLPEDTAGKLFDHAVLIQ